MVTSRKPGVSAGETSVAVAPHAAAPGPVGMRQARLNVAGGAARWVLAGPAPEAALPSDLVAIYRGLRVTYGDPVSGLARETVADIHTYVNTHIPRRCPNMARKDELLGFVRRELRAAAEERRMADAEDGDRLCIAHTFNGQGSPEEIRVTLRYALTFGQASADRLQAYCDEDPRIGLDCVGFAMNYFMYIGRLAERLGYIPSFAERGTARIDTTAIQARDILIWESQDPDAIGHIAVVDSKSAGSASMQVAEACSRGLSVSEYVVEDVRAGLFSVRRTGGGTSSVRIYALP